eukprot:COSAG05_NODE_11169_length_527_cov_0.740654_1_plen_95_part_00
MYKGLPLRAAARSTPERGGIGMSSDAESYHGCGRLNDPILLEKLRREAARRVIGQLKTDDGDGDRSYTYMCTEASHTSIHVFEYLNYVSQFNNI